jgi:AraC-like DNA-binding protein
MQKMEFATENLPPNFDDRARFSLWHDLCVANYCSLQLARPEDVPFAVRFQAIRFDTLRLGHFQGTVNDVARRPTHVKADGSDDFFLGFCRRGRMSFYQHGNETLLEPGGATLLSDTHAGGWKTDTRNEWMALTLPHKQLVTMVAGAENLLAQPIANGAALAHLRGYLDFLIKGGNVGEDSALDRHIETTLLDLVTLALGTSRDLADLAQQRGLRSARVRAVIEEIRKNYARPSFSPGHIARKFGVSERYVQDLLQDTNATFSERVLEMRLQHARSMLGSPRHDNLKIIDIALQSGFADISNFNKFFRRRFGVTPTQMRGSLSGS